MIRLYLTSRAFNFVSNDKNKQTNKKHHKSNQFIWCQALQNSQEMIIRVSESKWRNGEMVCHWGPSWNMVFDDLDYLNTFSNINKPSVF